MIYCFSGTGNSLRVAQWAAAHLNDRVVWMDEQTSHFAMPLGNEAVGLVFPVYAWGLPQTVERFVNNMPCVDTNTYVYAILTCGDDVGRCDDLLRRALRARNVTLHAVFSVRMRNTYICLPGFDVDAPEVEQRKHAEAERRVDEIARIVQHRERIFDHTQVHPGACAWLKSYALRPMFNRFLISDKRFRADRERCTQCGKCMSVCPLLNINADNTGMPAWNGHCTHCLRCYHACPRHAVQYGRYTQHKGQVHVDAAALRKADAGG